MERQKLQYLQKLLERRKEKSASRYIKAIRKCEARARKFYAGTIDLDKEEFVEMMLLDGCFIVEFFCKVAREELRDENDHIFQSEQIQSGLQRDLLLLENQIPFFVLVKLFVMTHEAQDWQQTMIDTALNFLKGILPIKINKKAPNEIAKLQETRFNLEAIEKIANGEIKHLLGLVHDSWCFSFATSLKKIEDKPADSVYRNSATELQEAGNNLEAPNEIAVIDIKHPLGLVHDSWWFSFARCFSFTEEKPEDSVYINSATELQEAGIKFKKLDSDNLFDVRFTKGVLEIPPLNVSEYTESPLRNLIAYEQDFSSDHRNYVSDYVVFMDWLINSPKDVQLLRRRRILINDIGDDASIYAMVNGMTQFIIRSTDDDYSYSDICHRLNEHCGKHLNKWMATLRREYFNNPWAWMSFFAALAVLGLTITQTVFSGVSL